MDLDTDTDSDTEADPEREGQTAVHPEQLKALKAMTPAQRLKAAMNLYWSARRLKAGWLRKMHPE